jgi:hypothetical protein
MKLRRLSFLEAKFIQLLVTLRMQKHEISGSRFFYTVALIQILMLGRNEYAKSELNVSCTLLDRANFECALHDIFKKKIKEPWEWDHVKTFAAMLD